MPLEFRKATSIGKDESIIEAFKNTSAQNVDIAKDHALRRGLGSVVDLPISLARMIPSVKNRLPDEKYREFLHSYQSKLIDLDRKGGEAAARKGKILNNIFTDTDLIPSTHVITTKGNVVPAYVPTEVRRVTAPLDKVKRLALPLLAVVGVSSLLDKKDSSNSKKKREGDAVVQKVSNTIREELITKLASTLASLNTTTALNASNKKKAKVSQNSSGHCSVSKDKIEKAAMLLNKASSHINSLEEKIAELTGDNKALKLKVLAKERSNRAVKLAKEMVRKQMIKQAEYTSQIDYIMSLSDDNFEILRNTVDSVLTKNASPTQNNKYSVDKISSLILEDNLAPERPSFEESILNLMR